MFVYGYFYLSIVENVPVSKVSIIKYVYYIKPFLACRSRQASIVLERYFRFEISLLSIFCLLIARMEMGTIRVSGNSDIIT